MLSDANILISQARSKKFRSAFVVLFCASKDGLGKMIKHSLMALQHGKHFGCAEKAMNF